MPIDLPIHEWPLSYESRLEQRAPSAIDLVVIHCTELPDMAMAREYGERVHYPDKGTGNSGHYYIDTDGSVHRFVAATRVANHTRGYNSRSIGIELSNIGRYPNWGDSKHQQFTRPYTKAQIDALLALLRLLRNELPDLKYIAGHEDLDTAKVPASDDPSQQVFRKRDPGPQFDWPRVLAASALQRLPPL